MHGVHAVHDGLQVRVRGRTLELHQPVTAVNDAVRRRAAHQRRVLDETNQVHHQAHTLHKLSPRKALLVDTPLHRRVDVVFRGAASQPFGHKLPLVGIAGGKVTTLFAG